MYFSFDCTLEELRQIIKDIEEISDRKNKIIEDMKLMIKDQSAELKELRSKVDRASIGFPTYPKITLKNDDITAVFEDKPF